MSAMNHESTLEQLGPLATDIRELLFREWEPCRSGSGPSAYDAYVPAIHRLAVERPSVDVGVDIEHIAAYLNFVVKNYLGRVPDKMLNLSVAERIFSMAEPTRQRQGKLP